MNKRRSIAIEGLSHLTEIPVASQIGPLLVSSVIAPFNPGTRDIPETLEDQYANIFLHTGRMLQAADADWRHIAKMEFWTPTADKGVLDPLWVEKFPDPQSRPARHTHVGQGTSARASSLAFEGFVDPLSLRTNCSAAASISASEAGGSKLCSVRMLRHITFS